MCLPFVCLEMLDPSVDRDKQQMKAAKAGLIELEATALPLHKKDMVDVGMGQDHLCTRTAWV